MKEATEVPMICYDCGGTLTDDDAIWSWSPSFASHINYSQCIASLNERLTAATQRAEAAEAERDAARDKNIELHERVRTYNNRAKKLGQKQKKNSKLAKYADESNALLRAERDALRKDAAVVAALQEPSTSVLIAMQSADSHGDVTDAQCIEMLRAAVTAALSALAVQPTTSTEDNA